VTDEFHGEKPNETKWTFDDFDPLSNHTPAAVNGYDANTEAMTPEDAQPLNHRHDGKFGDQVGGAVSEGCRDASGVSSGSRCLEEKDVTGYRAVDCPFATDTTDFDEV